MFKNMKIIAKVGWGYTIILGLLVLLCGMCLLSIVWLSDTIEDFFEHPFTVSRSIRMTHTDVLLIQRETGRMALGRVAKDDPETLRRLEGLSKEINGNLAMIRDRYLGTMDTVQSLQDKYKICEDLRADVLRLIRENRRDEALALFHGRYSDSVDNLETEMREVAGFAAGKAEYFRKAAAEVRTYSFALVAVVGALAVGLVLVMGVYLTRSIRRSTHLALDVARRLTHGEVGIDFQVPYHDEFGEILEALRKVADEAARMAKTADEIAAGNIEVHVVPRSDQDRLGVAMQNMLDSIRLTVRAAERIAMGDLTANITPRSERDGFGQAMNSMVTQLRREILQIMDGVSLLASSVTQIMTSTAELASISGQTAAAISETTTTMEEVRHTAMLSNQKAAEVRDSAARSVDVSREGRITIDETFKMLDAVQRQISSIAERMDVLSEKSQAIGEIILTVNGLAEQSNLLAVNASIEAVKAGEFGRGFAVVAEEVRSLAEQSKTATGQVRAILADIRKATAAAALSVDQGSKSVDELLRQSGKAEETIRSLSGGVVESADSASQIAASIGQQLAGVDQIVQAMDNIRQASRQNADSARQLESAAKNLKEFGEKLQAMVGRYKV